MIKLTFQEAMLPNNVEPLNGLQWRGFLETQLALRELAAAERYVGDVY